MNKNFLTRGKLLKNTLTTVRNEIWNNINNFKYEDRSQGFKETYAGAEWHVKTIYCVCEEILDCFNTYESFATQVKNAMLALGRAHYGLNEYSHDAFNEVYSLYLTKIAPDEEIYYHVRDLANGEEEEYYVEPTYDEFIEHLEDCEYHFEYEDWDQTERAIYWLSESLGYEIINYAFDYYMALEGGEN